MYIVIFFLAFTCPPGAPSDNYPDPTDCGYFYSCVGNRKFRMTCPSGLQFNPVMKFCDYPSNANCHISQVTDQTAHPTVTTSYVTTGTYFRSGLTSGPITMYYTLFPPFSC